MSRTLPALRRTLEVMPSPVPDRPGLLIRDPLGYAESTLIVPPQLVPALACFDGRCTELDLRARLTQLSGQLEVGDLMRHLIEAVEGGGFLDGEVFEARRRTCQQAFAAAAVREPVHAGGAYPADLTELRGTLDGWSAGGAGPDEPEPPGRLLGIAAPHVSPEGGAASYRDAFGALSALGPAAREKLFVVLGTSHYGEPETFGLTRKPYATPLGQTRAEPQLVERLEEDGGPAASAEDYCHAVEHSIEFQVLFLQHAIAPDVAVLPILCGPFARHTLGPGLPEQDDGVTRFFDALRALAEREAERLVWVLGIDLAHMGRRYGDDLEARKYDGAMEGIAEQDRARLDRALVGDASGLWAAIQKDADPLKWCGASALYTFLRVATPRVGSLRRYEQWNIDEASVVSFAALTFHA